MTLGGFSTTSDDAPRPLGARNPAPPNTLWCLGETPVRTVPADDGRPRVLVVGWCGATAGQLRGLSGRPVPADVTWRWSGSYAVVEERAECVVVHTDPVAAFPLYATRWDDGWAWSTSARALASLTGADVDVGRVACAILAPSVPALAGDRTFFSGVEQLPPGSRIELPRNGDQPRRATTWCPEPERHHMAHRRLRRALADAVALRTRADPTLSSDLSGGLDSTTVAVLAARSLDGSHVLDAVTIHPEGRLDGADLRYARMAAAASSGRISHHLLPLGASHLPYGGITSVSATDEPAPSTLTQARLLGQFRWMTRELGTRTHLTGDGGDSVLFLPPAQLCDLMRAGRWGRALREAHGWARLRRTPVVPLLRGAVAMTRTGRPDALADLARCFSRGRTASHDRENVRWFTAPPIPSWAEPVALGHVAGAAAQAAAFDPLPGLDASVHTLVDEIREVARTARADAELAKSCGIDLHNPFLDPSVADAVLRDPLEHRPPVHGYKPLLVRAVGDLLPPAVASRTTKGSFEADHFTGMRTHLDDLQGLGDGYLASLGLLDPTRFRRHLRYAAAGVPMPLATLEQALMAEAWLHAHHRDPAPAWGVDLPGRST